MRKFVPGLGIGALVFVAASAASAEPVIIKCARPCTSVIQAVEQNGGVVTYRYKYVNAIAAEVTTSALSAVRGIAELGAVREDYLIQLPNEVAAQRGAPQWALAESTGASPLGEAQMRALAGQSPERVHRQQFRDEPECPPRRRDVRSRHPGSPSSTPASAPTFPISRWTAPSSVAKTWCRTPPASSMPATMGMARSSPG